ncbi:MAG: biotin/lipoate--protein ligase family protein [Pseudomonadota bacterium]
MIALPERKDGDPTLPPLLTGFGIGAPDQPFDHAVAGARVGVHEAGHVVWARNTSMLDWAIVLAPEVPLRKAVQMVPLAMVAAGDCVGVLTPPQVALTFRWPDGIIVNGGIAGRIEATASTDDPDAVPDWLVVRVVMRIRHEQHEEPGNAPDQTSLEEEGCTDLMRNHLIESYSRHFLTWLNTWNDDGFAPVHGAWLQRAESLEEHIAFTHGDAVMSGVFMGLDEDGNILLKSNDSAGDGAVELVSLADVVLSGRSDAHTVSKDDGR